MTPFDIIVLSLIQGLTEFLPISSSGHLVLANAILGLKEPGIATEIVLHAGTLLAVVLYYRRDLVKLAAGTVRSFVRGGGGEARDARNLLLALLVGTLPAVVAGLAAGGRLEALYENPRESAIEIVVTGLILISTLLVRRGSRGIGLGTAVVIGIAQAVALLPGISRSGMTIAAALYLGVLPEEAARFSFLLSIPAILGGVVLKIPEVMAEAHAGEAGFLGVGFLLSFLVGYLSIAALLRVVRRGRFGIFGAYCVLAGVAALLLLR
jgi:undecaprenyl-diphosphatase